MIAPLVEKLDEQYKNIKFAEVDVDQSQPIARKYEVSSMPTFVYFHNKTEVDRTVGANPQALNTALATLSTKSSSPVASSSEAADAGSGSGSELLKQIENYIPKGYELLNDSITFNDAEALNITQSDAHENQLKPLFNTARLPAAKETGLVSDADSQMIIYIPLTNKSKVYSILLRKSASSDEDVQPPNKIKVWANTTGTISFDDAAQTSSLHDGDIDNYDANGWAEIKLRYVRFQNVTSLLVFLDGDDEDESTALQRLVIIGNKGESRDRGKLEKIE
ncbi:hypothetical protein DV451_003525 [Geotrichum candidum]|nr:hypothetical protein DV451_003525 [Geotrichum candidum]KAF5107713.1 hypothetical protein DV453_002866 [Geotrichum candidum]KAF5115240.1 hypothetical protein DV454_002390 [Geotrichum candidum]KAF5135773.1 hypothetical protein DV495_000521 [Geotrichum candidum]KAI8135373.1 hypothetical protein DUD61_000986 [Geotrichum candidum]